VDNDTITETIGKALDVICPHRTVRMARNDDIVDLQLEKSKKKRKRMLKEYNLTKDKALLDRINKLNKTIKSKIVQARKSQIMLKLNGKNPKSFWNAVATLEGKNEREKIALEINGTLTRDDAQIAEEFAEFFANKVKNLSNDYGKLDYKIGHYDLEITKEEVISAAKNMKSKLCTGEDGLPMKFIRDLVNKKPEIFANLFKTCCQRGIPRRWKMAIVVPLHKNGSKTQTSQYRPVSNLDSIGKVFERVILAKLDSLGELDGVFQHGFKANRSTVSAMLELQEFVATNLDDGNVVGTYSIDLSAAFDVLRPDVFYTQLKEEIPENLMAILLDFMSNRTFKVQVNNDTSLPKNLKVGCVQGSILGPRLFTLYMRNLKSLTENTHLVSFADDTYVSIAAKTIEEVKEKIISKMTKHDELLKSIGMVTNVSKTELIYFARKPLEEGTPIVVNGEQVIPKKAMKVLGVYFQNNLQWESHMEKLKNKARLVLSKMKYLSRYVDMNCMKRIITSHYFGMLYYGAAVWLNEMTTSKMWTLLNSLHYKGLRTALRDFNKAIKRPKLDEIFNRATPHRWMRYVNAKMAIQMMLIPTRAPPLAEKLKQNVGTNDRTGKLSTRDTSKLKIGKHAMQNRLTCLREVRFDWKQGISKEKLRIELKKTFFV